MLSLYVPFNGSFLFLVFVVGALFPSPPAGNARNTPRAKV